MFDQIIKQKADSHEAPVPPDAWNNIIKKDKRRRFGFFWWTACVLLCTLSVIGYYKFNRESAIGNRESANGNRELAIDKPGNQLQTPTPVGSNNETVTTIINNEKTNAENSSGIGNLQSARGNRQTPNPVGTNYNAQNIVTADENKFGRRLQNPTAVGSNNNTVAPNEKTDTKNKIAVKKKNKPGLQNQDGNHNVLIDQTLKGSLTVKTKPSSHKNKVETDATNKNSNQQNDRSLAKKNNTVKKDKGRSFFKVESGATSDETLNEHIKTETGIQDVAINDPAKNNDGQKITDDNRQINTLTPPLKNELVVDSAQRTAVATTPVENKIEKNAVNKPGTKHAWFVDAGVSPVLPIQQYDKAATFSRKQVLSNNVTLFSGKLTGTSMDAAVAYSIALRRELGKRISVGAGLQYLKLNEQVTISGTETNTKYTIVDRLVDNIGGPQLISDTIATVTQGNRKIAATNSYTFLSVPVFIQYDFIKKQEWSLGVVAGAYINVLSNYTNEINRNHDAQLTASSQSGQQKSSIGVALYGGFRFGKQITKKLELFGTPSITWALGTQNTKNSLLNKKIQQAGLNIGLSYKLN
ncbi:MAG: hypothetical protein ABIN36_13990 [Ferruginibacter sp.]